MNYLMCMYNVNALPVYLCIGLSDALDPMRGVFLSDLLREGGGRPREMIELEKTTCAITLLESFC